MQPQLGIWKRFIRSLLRVDRCTLSWASGRGLLEVCWGWTDAASAGHLEDKMFIVQILYASCSFHAYLFAVCFSIYYKTKVYIIDIKDTNTRMN